MIWESLVLIGSGVVIAVGCIFVGAWLMFKATASKGESLFTEPKGEVFSIPDSNIQFPGEEEPGMDEKTILKNTSRFLKSMGGAE